MSVFKLWCIVIFTVTVFDFGLPFTCALWARSVFNSEAKSEILTSEEIEDNIPQNLRLENNLKRILSEEPWSEMEIDSEDTYIDGSFADSTFSFTDRFVIPPEYKDDNDKINSLLQAKILKGVDFMNNYGFKEKGVRDISYYTNKQTHQKFVKIVYTIYKDFMPSDY